MEQEELEKLVSFFKVLANENRLKIIGILASRECSVGELAALLNLREPTISQYLNQLKELNLVGMRPEGNSRVYWLDVKALQQMNKELLTRERIVALADDVPGGAWERKVLNTFMQDGQLTKIPDTLKKRLVILKWLVNQFEQGVRYPEAAVNTLIKQYHPDTATLRRELIINGMMQRHDNIYWRLPEPEDSPPNHA